jgi:hypothetical protein
LAQAKERSNIGHHASHNRSNAQIPSSQNNAISAEIAIQEVSAGNSVDQKEISERLERKNVTFPEHVSFSNCNFSEQIDLSGCHFEKGVEFIGCAFAKTVSMESCRSEGDFQLRACVFNEEVRFERLQVNGKLEVRAPRNKSVLTEAGGFREKPWVAFTGFANFSQIHVSGEANFGSAQFERGVDFITHGLKARFSSEKTTARHIGEHKRKRRSR